MSAPNKSDAYLPLAEFPVWIWVIVGLLVVSLAGNPVVNMWLLRRSKITPVYKKEDGEFKHEDEKGCGLRTTRWGSCG